LDWTQLRIRHFACRPNFYRLRSVGYFAVLMISRIMEAYEFFCLFERVIRAGMFFHSGVTIATCIDDNGLGGV
jgi:hypothetical protein